MKKKTKGLVALGATAAILTGTAGTFALWHDTAALGTGTDQIATGNLALTGAPSGSWQWENVSHGTLPNNLAFTGDSSKLVPGDAVKYVWGASQPTITLVGDTIVANLYLDGLQITPSDLAPLVVVVNGEKATEAVSGGILIPGITATTISSANIQSELPTITIGFPLAANPVKPAQGSVGDANFSDGYGRGKTFADVINVSKIEIRLEQQTGNDVFRTPVAAPTQDSDDEE